MKKFFALTSALMFMIAVGFASPEVSARNGGGAPGAAATGQGAVSSGGTGHGAGGGNSGQGVGNVCCGNQGVGVGQGLAGGDRGGGGCPGCGPGPGPGPDGGGKSTSSFGGKNGAFGTSLGGYPRWCYTGKHKDRIKASCLRYSYRW